MVLTSLVMDPDRALLWASPLVFQSLEVTGGSGHYRFTYQSQSSVQFTEKRNAVQVRWVGSGENLPVDISVKVWALSECSGGSLCVLCMSLVFVGCVFFCVLHAHVGRCHAYVACASCAKHKARARACVD